MTTNELKKVLEDWVKVFGGEHWTVETLHDICAQSYSKNEILQALKFVEGKLVVRFLYPGRNHQVLTAWRFADPVEILRFRNAGKQEHTESDT